MYFLSEQQCIWHYVTYTYTTSKYVAAFYENTNSSTHFTDLEVNTILQLSNVCPSNSLLILQRKHHNSLLKITWPKIQR